MNNNLMKISVVAWRLSVSEAFVYALIAKGRLKHYRLGSGQGGLRVSEGHLQDYLKASEKCREPEPAAPPMLPPLKHLSLD